MSTHKRFSDGAGYTRHCWECKHATSWRKADTIDGYEASCRLCGIVVGKFDSPNNPCCNLPSACDHSEN